LKKFEGLLKEFAYSTLDSAVRKTGHPLRRDRMEALAKLRGRGAAVTSLVEKRKKSEFRFAWRKGISLQGSLHLSGK
jgi:hypothetical protein